MQVQTKFASGIEKPKDTESVTAKAYEEAVRLLELDPKNLANYETFLLSIISILTKDNENLSHDIKEIEQIRHLSNALVGLKHETAKIAKISENFRTAYGHSNEYKRPKFYNEKNDVDFYVRRRILLNNLFSAFTSFVDNKYFLLMSSFHEGGEPRQWWRILF